MHVGKICPCKEIMRRLHRWNANAHARRARSANRPRARSTRPVNETHSQSLPYAETSRLYDEN